MTSRQRPRRETRQAVPPPQYDPRDQNDEENNNALEETPDTIKARPTEIIGQDGALLRSGTAVAIRGFSSQFGDSSYSQDFEDEPQGVGGYYLNIAQSQSQPVLDEFKDTYGQSWLGQLYLSGTSIEDPEKQFDTPASEVIAVPIAGAAKRQKWAQNGNERTLQCWAMAKKFSELIGEGDPGGECKNCPHSKWVRDSNGKRTTGCNRTYSFVLYIPEWEEICVWDLSATSADVGREFLKWCQQRGWANFAVSIWTSQVTSVDYALSTDGTAILLAEENKAVAAQQGGGRNRRAPSGNRWFVPECQIMEGTLEDNNIYLPMAEEEEEEDNQDYENLPF